MGNNIPQPPLRKFRMLFLRSWGGWSVVYARDHIEAIEKFKKGEYEIEPGSFLQ